MQLFISIWQIQIISSILLQIIAILLQIIAILLQIIAFLLQIISILLQIIAILLQITSISLQIILIFAVLDRSYNSRLILARLIILQYWKCFNIQHLDI